MPEIYLLSPSEIYSKVLELILQDKEVNFSIIKSEENFIEPSNNIDLAIIDEEFSENILDIVNRFLDKNIPVIFLKDIFSDKHIHFKENDKVKIIDKPFEDEILLNEIKNFIKLTPKKNYGEKKMAEEKNINNQDDILELTEVVDEGNLKGKKDEEVSDIFSAKKDDEKILDDFFEKEEDDNANDLMDKKDLSFNGLLEDELKDSKDDKESIKDLEEETPKIPIEEETIEIAKEIENGKTEIKEKINIEKEKEQSSSVDFSRIEAKLLEATDRIMEAIEESTVEIAKAIAKVTPKIIEEVAREIIPAVAKKIIKEEISKKEDEN